MYGLLLSGYVVAGGILNEVGLLKLQCHWLFH